MEAWIGILTR